MQKDKEMCICLVEEGVGFQWESIGQVVFFFKQNFFVLIESGGINWE